MNDKFAVVTGASTGIGKTIALELTFHGAVVALCGRTEEALLATKKLINEQGGKAEVFLGDFSNIDSLNALIRAIKNKTKYVDILVNVAGVWHGKNEVYAGKDFESFPQKVVLDTYTVGITAPTLLAHAFVPLMKQGGKIVNISGTFESGAKGWLPYYVSKKAIEDLTVGLAEELKNKKICVNAVSPSDTATEAYKKYFPQYLQDAIAPEEIAKQVVLLCSNKPSVTGKVLVMKKGKKPYEGFHT